MKTITFRGYVLNLFLEEYVIDGSTSIQLVDSSTGEDYMTASVYIDGLSFREIAIKDYSENTGILAVLIAEGVVASPHRYVKQGFVNIPVCELLISNQ